MKGRILLICLILLASLSSCGKSKQPEKMVAAIERPDSCTLDAKNSYEAYIPKHGSTEKLSLLVILDSHGGGKFALAKFKQTADKYDVALVASNLVKNGFQGFDEAIQKLIADAKQKFPLNELVYVTGFSGGARMALSYGMAHGVRGLLLCGALGSTEQLNALTCPVVSVSGMDDFNFPETAQFMFQEETCLKNLMIELTESSHSWPDSQMLSDAFGYLSFWSTTINPSIEEFVKHQKERVELFKKQGDWIKAELIAGNMSKLANLDQEKSFSSLYDSMKSSPEYVNQMNQLGQCLNEEMNLRQTYIQAFSTKDDTWWRNEIVSNDEKIKTTSDKFHRDMYKRIKGLWGIACYSLCKQAVNMHDVAMLTKILGIYRQIEPENSDMYYYSAFLPYWKGDEAATVSDLKQALKLGFGDKAQMKAEFSQVFEKIGSI